MRPSAPLSMACFSLSSPGSQSLSCTAPFLTPAASAVRARSSATSRLSAIGFSQYTCLPAAIAFFRSSARICVEPASKKIVSSGLARASSRLSVQRSTPCSFARCSTFAALRPTRMGSGINRSPFGSGIPFSARMARMERIRCWFIPILPVTPCMMIPILRSIQIFLSVKSVVFRALETN